MVEEIMGRDEEIMGGKYGSWRETMGKSVSYKENKALKYLHLFKDKLIERYLGPPSISNEHQHVVKMKKKVWLPWLHEYVLE